MVSVRERGEDPGDRATLEWAANEQRVLITIDTDFGELIYKNRSPNYGMIRLPDVPSASRNY